MRSVNTDTAVMQPCFLSNQVSETETTKSVLKQTAVQHYFSHSFHDLLSEIVGNYKQQKTDILKKP